MNPSQKPEEQPKKKTSLIKTILLVLGSVLAVACVGGLGWGYKTYRDMYRSTDISLLDKEPARSTFFYDRSGAVMAELTNARMEYRPLSEFPATLLDAVTAVEDARFYEHHGLDYQGIARALYQNLKSGHTVEGGSTITQQLAKTMLLSPEQTYERKLKEAVASLKIEHTYSKDQIMEMYLNHIYFGEGAWGLQRASETYFGKEASQLTLSESALLAGIPKSPTNYSPVARPEASKERRNLVLSLMAEQGKITAAQRDEAMREEIKLAPPAAQQTARIYPSYIDHVINEASQKYGLTEQQILSSGLHIHTNLDPKVQKAAEEVMRNPEFFPEDEGGLQSGIVLMEPKSGAVLGIVGSRNPEPKFREFNYATQNERQPGSTIKPLIVYAPALAAGYGPRDQIYDTETDFGGGYTPANYKKQLHGWVTLEEALVESYNIPAVAMLKEIGIDRGLDFAKKAGLPMQEADRTLGIALGGMSQGTSPLQMAQAYTMFANGGNLAKAYAIRKITDAQGKLVGQEVQPALEPMLDPSAAYTMTKMLEKVVTEGTGRAARMERPVAGKTGTTQLPDTPEFKDRRGNQIDGSKDAWFVGYTPEIVAAVWLGYEKTNKDHYLTTTGGKYPASLFKEVVSRALLDVSVTAFEKPEKYRAFAGGRKRINGDKAPRYGEKSGGTEQAQTGTAAAAPGQEAAGSTAPAAAAAPGGAPAAQPQGEQGQAPPAGADAAGGQAGGQPAPAGQSAPAPQGGTPSGSAPSEPDTAAGGAAAGGGAEAGAGGTGVAGGEAQPGGSTAQPGSGAGSGATAQPGADEPAAQTAGSGKPAEEAAGPAAGDAQADKPAGAGTTTP
ncbi:MULTISPECIES: transglycosylase domain-containing protein [Paenibacillus]|uniref:transglycosylase domain-containing protein n=1 Tax=Paenibacillus TaxID=44249 RepID=UPI0022B9197D|nr:PBP1A family penicillin-binding protein [Paenibacillus caseinilyticus]MCZ8518464.1 PBP1A family penicillin-binding protein [Paenibacillus caseinilyticus]